MAKEMERSLMDYKVSVAYNDRIYENVIVEADDEDGADFEARNIIMDHNPEAYDLAIVSIKEA